VIFEVHLESTNSGFRWFIYFIDDCTRTTWLYLLKEKSEAAQSFQNFHKMIQTQFHSQIQILRTDNAREYFNSILESLIGGEWDCAFLFMCRYPQQNGAAKRKNRHLLEGGRALMFSRNVPKFLWGEVILTTTYLTNRMPSKIQNLKVPINLLKEVFPRVNLYGSLPPRIFGV